MIVVFFVPFPRVSAVPCLVSNVSFVVVVPVPPRTFIVFFLVEGLDPPVVGVLGSAVGFTTGFGST